MGLNSSLVVLGESDLAATADDTGSSGSNETSLLTTRGVSSDGRGVTDVLMVTTTVRMLDGVHGNTSNSGPVAFLGVSLEVGVVGLQDRLVSSGATSADTDHASAATEDGLADAGGKSDSGLLAILGVADNDGGGAGGTGKAATVTELSLNVGDDGALRHHINGQNVADGQRCFGAAVEELAGVHAFDSDEKLSVLLEFVLVSENDLGKGSATAGIVHDVLHDSLDVSFALGKVQSSEGGGGDPLRGMGLENSATTTSLC
eukprot:CAMPEP_0170459426 /NCGR_PEP_ID=MMETSP0123-20130129/6122_1 /TAXON_ID=182087 /ORGANISM="Favella ehrenbergii, Strain Fehren 1" /LENGTH=259 /DNA_ID=CAMNT_0010724015 /DNA_START=129 /DNA_END=909 /DNA_ORIENTATION=+